MKKKKIKKKIRKLQEELALSKAVEVLDQTHRSCFIIQWDIDELKKELKYGPRKKYIVTLKNPTVDSECLSPQEAVANWIYNFTGGVYPVANAEGALEDVTAEMLDLFDIQTVG